MANIPIRDIPGAVVASPDPSNLIPMDNGSLMQKTTIANAVNTVLPLASQATAEAGVNNSDRMSSLRTKQAIDAQTPAIVNSAITSLNLGTMSQEESSDYTPTSGLAAVALSNDYGDLSNLPTLGTMSQETASDYTKTSGLAAVALSNDYNDLDNLPTLGSAAATDASDYATAAQGSLADTAVQPGDSALVPAGGTIGQVLVKNSGTNYDTGWVSSAAATAVSYAPQTLTDAQAGQARANIDAGLLSGFRNKIINGDLTGTIPGFPINQRGVATPLTPGVGVYGYDRWKGHANGLEQIIEGLPAGTYTLTFGGGGTGSVGGQTPAASPAVFTVAIGGNISVVVPATASRVSLVEGDATAEDDPFSPRHIQQEIAMCQRYYAKSYQMGDAPGTVTNVGALGFRFGSTAANQTINIALPVEMRAPPTVTFYNPVTGTTGTFRNVNTNADAAAGNGSTGASSGARNISAAVTTGTSPDFYSGHYTADSEL